VAAADEMMFDGNLGEACAVEEYGMKLVKARSNVGFDGYTPDCGMMSPIPRPDPDRLGMGRAPLLCPPT
jgi:hypothetical protein